MQVAEQEVFIMKMQEVELEVMHLLLELQEHQEIQELLVSEQEVVKVHPIEMLPQIVAVAAADIIHQGVVMAVLAL
jgi:hypothetical protein